MTTYTVHLPSGHVAACTSNRAYKMALIVGHGNPRGYRVVGWYETEYAAKWAARDNRWSGFDAVVIPVTVTA